MCSSKFLHCFNLKIFIRQLFSEPTTRAFSLMLYANQSVQNCLLTSELDVLDGISKECFLFFAKISPDLNHGFSFVLMPEWQCFFLPFITIFRNNKYPHEDLLYFGEEFHSLTRKYQQVTSWHSHILIGNYLINSEFITLIENSRKSSQEFKCL